MTSPLLSTLFPQLTPQLAASENMKRHAQEMLEKKVEKGEVGGGEEGRQFQ